MTHDGELCAALPMTQIGLTAWFCHVHQGWCWAAHVYRQGGEDEIQVLHSRDGDLGPFDDPKDLVNLFEATLDTAIHHLQADL